MVRKTAADYAAEIKELWPATNEAEETVLNRKISSFVKLLDITIFRANNEQLPWSEDELWFPVRDMLLKKDFHIQQVGDYQAYYSSPVCSGWVGVLVERKGGKKGCEDLYSTLINSENCSRFYREVERFREDVRFSQMVVIAECSFEQYLLFKPPFIGKTFNQDHIGASVEARRGKIASLYTRGIPVIFAGTRLNAIKTYQALIRQWLIKNIDTVLKLNVAPYSDLDYLEEKKARLELEKDKLEADLEAVNASLTKLRMNENEALEVEA
jgi:hypothetical protein